MEAIVVDVDGTVCFDGHTIADDIADALREVNERSRLIFASARPIRDLLPVLPDDLASVDVIGGNGAFIRAGGELTVQGFDTSMRLLIDTLIAEHAIGALLDGSWDYSYTGDENHPLRARIDPGALARQRPAHELTTYAKALLFTTSDAVTARLHEMAASFSVHPVEGAIDVAPPGVSKASAIASLGIGTFAAFGNDANDVTMMRDATFSVRVGAHPALGFADRTVEQRDVAAALRESMS